MQAMGNNRARAVYEANLPVGFRRPLADSSVVEESFERKLIDHSILVHWKHLFVPNMNNENGLPKIGFHLK